MGGRLIDWLGSGDATDRPAAVDMPARIVIDSTAMFFAQDTKVLGVFDPSGPSWFDIDLAALAAFTTEALQDMIATFLMNGTGISLSYDDSGNHLTVNCTITQYTDEQAQDAIAALIAAGSHVGLTIAYNDASNTLSFTNTITQYTNEMAMDAIATMLAAGTHTGITVSYNDAGDAMSLAVTITQYTNENAMDAIAAMLAAGTHGGLTVSYNDAGDAMSLAISQAAASDVWTGTATGKVVTPKAIFDASAPVSVADASTITLDGNTGFNFYTTLAGNRIIANPTNMKAGQSGVWHFTQDGTGTRVPSWGTNWRFAGGAAVGGLLSTAAGAVDCVSYFVRADGSLTCSILKDVKA